MDTANTQILKALRYLSENDQDRAREKNNVGFNAFDGVLGRDLASRDTLSERQAAIALNMLRKYVRQLDGAGIVLPEKIDVEIPSNGDLAIEKVGANVGICFKSIPSPEVRAKIKEIRGWKWNPDLPGKPWTVPAFCLPELKKIFPDATVMEEAQELYEASDASELPVVDAPKAVVISDAPKAKIDLVNGKLSVSAPYNAEKVARIKEIPDRKFIAESKTWQVPVQYAQKLFDIYPDAEVSDIAKSKLDESRKVLQVSNRDIGVDVPGLKKELFDYQKVGVNFLDSSSGGVILSDSMGIGKTPQAIGYLQLRSHERPAIIVVPASLKINWQREIEAWSSTGDNIVILSGESIKPDIVCSLKSAGIVIVNYDILESWIDEIKKINPQVLIADEAHYLKNQKTKRWKATSQIRDVVKRVILLTGTPVLNRPAELFALLNMIDKKKWGNFFSFAQRYCDAKQKEIRIRGGGKKLVWDFSGASNLDELFTYTRDCVLRRTKKDVLKELPPKRRVTIALPISDSDRSQYEKVLEETTRKVREGLSNGETHHALTQVEILKQECVNAKMDSAIEWIETFLGNDEKLVVFATHHKTIDRLSEHFGDVCVTLTGESSPKQRQYAVDAFQGNDKVRLFIGNIQAAGVGITLTAASNVAFVEFGWTPGDMEQAEDRIHRIGQDAENVTAWYLIADNTIDEKIINLIEEKRTVVENVTDGKISENRFESVAHNFMAGLVRGQYAIKI